MNYKKIMGYDKKKKVIKENKVPKKNTVLDNVKKDVLNEAVALGITTMKDNTPFKTPKQMNEGPAYEYSKVFKDIEKGENQQAKAVNNFVKLLKKKGFPKEATNVAYTYMGTMRKFNDYLEELKGKLL